jgi:hypothetical protein
MTICNLSGLVCMCQPDEDVPCLMEGDGLKNLMLSWRAEAIRLQGIIDGQAGSAAAFIPGEFVLFALKRAVETLRAIGDKNSSKEDLYGGLFWYDDAETIENFVNKVDSPSSSGIARILHYPDCWDTAAYPTLESAVIEALSSEFKCSDAKHWGS